jgi:hypothetical protein
MIEELRNCCIVRSALSVFFVAIATNLAMSDESSTGAIDRTQPSFARTGPKSDRLDQGSCWYAIFFCSLRPSEALRWTERHANGRVIDTLSKEFPGLKKGYYCAVEGPTSRKSALDKAQSSKRLGKAPAAYAKEGC